MYRFYQWMAFFYIYCIGGWIWETSYVSLCEKRFVNRGFLHGPVIPLYGSGAVAMLFLALPLKENLVLTYVAGVVGATLLELVTGWAMESIFKVKYWDYSKQKIQFRGYICLSSSLFWGVLTIALVRWMHGPIERFVLRQPDWMVIAGVSLFTAGFLYDLYISAKEALDLRKVLVALEKVRAEIEEAERELAARVEQGRQQASEYWEQSRQQASEYWEQGRQQASEYWEQTRIQLSERVEESREQLAQRLEQSRGQLSGRLEESRREWEQKLSRLYEQKEIQIGEFRLAHRRLRRRHPTATAGRLEGLLTEVRRKIGESAVRETEEEKTEGAESFREEV